jgi:glyoxylase-like metal-dependent hydrolase (beta-lactamase superfamily II)
MPEIHTLKLGVCNCYVIRGKSTILVDAGPPRQEKRFIRKILSFGIDPEDISLIFITHAHMDHIGSLHGIKAITEGEVVINHREEAIVEQALHPVPPGVTPWGKFIIMLMKLSQKNISFEGTSVDIALDDAPFSLTPYGIDGKIVSTPGHSSGSMSLILESGDAFVGDLFMNGFPMRKGPGIPIFADDIDTVKKSARFLLENGVKFIYPGHGEPFNAALLDKQLL